MHGAWCMVHGMGRVRVRVGEAVDAVCVNAQMEGCLPLGFFMAMAPLEKARLPTRPRGMKALALTKRLMVARVLRPSML